MAWKVRKDGKFDTGRKQIVDDSVLQKLQTAFSLGCSDEEASSFAEIAVSTLYNYQKKNPDFLEWKQQLKEKPILKARNTVVKSLDDPKIALEYLKAKKKDEFGQRMEITGTDGTPLAPPVINILPVQTKNEE